MLTIMNSLRPRSLLLPLVSAALLSACGLPTPAVHAELRVSEAGTYLLDTVPVAATALPEVLQARHAQVPTLLVQVRASPHASIESVRLAVAAAKSAHVRLAFADEVPQLQASLSPHITQNLQPTDNP